MIYVLQCMNSIYMLLVEMVSHFLNLFMIRNTRQINKKSNLVKTI